MVIIKKITELTVFNKAHDPDLTLTSVAFSSVAAPVFVYRLFFHTLHLCFLLHVATICVTDKETVPKSVRSALITL